MESPVSYQNKLLTGLVMAAPRRFLACAGMYLADGVNQSEDASLAARNALLTLIQPLMEGGGPVSKPTAYAASPWT